MTEDAAMLLMLGLSLLFYYGVYRLIRFLLRASKRLPYPLGEATRVKPNSPSQCLEGADSPTSSDDHAPAKLTTKLRLFGAAVLVFNLWLIGAYELKGIPVLLLTFGFAVAYELLVVRPISKEPRSK